MRQARYARRAIASFVVVLAMGITMLFTGTPTSHGQTAPNAPATVATVQR